MIAVDFLETIRDFWRLLSNSSALVKLAIHYSMSGWERWKRSNTDDTDVTAYENLEGAVAAHPEKCLRFLATTWGLQYSDLQRPGDGIQRKRKAETDDGFRPKTRAWEGLQDEMVESIISRNESGEMFRQDNAVRNASATCSG
ncbi:hypothetical protein AOQ84DRAFT_388452 [Glonium stellatum]|uniref:Uncharacterized protein n=1 Tax=Glonium stellatum TaxID=574774 RepID=A0A8E2F1X3_9PEZI|nr:hypothetical protein AOQ84DRAFT_388452 [Glonium stellatum]